MIINYYTNGNVTTVETNTADSWWYTTTTL